MFTLLGAIYVLLPFALLLNERARALFRPGPKDGGPGATRP